jgi:hypothetical protein
MKRAKLFAKIVALDFFNAVIIVLATRAYVAKSYAWTGILEVVFVTQWFKSRNISFDEVESRKWSFGYPAYLLGSTAGTLFGLWLSVHTLGQ